MGWSCACVHQVEGGDGEEYDLWFQIQRSYSIFELIVGLRVMVGPMTDIYEWCWGERVNKYKSVNLMSELQSKDQLWLVASLRRTSSRESCCQAHFTGTGNRRRVATDPQKSGKERLVYSYLWVFFCAVICKESFLSFLFFCFFKEAELVFSLKMS